LLLDKSLMVISSIFQLQSRESVHYFSALKGVTGGSPDAARVPFTPPSQTIAAFPPWNSFRTLRDDYSPAQEHEIRNCLNPKLSG